VINIRRRKAVSPVIATVILVAVAITVAVAVSYWMSGISAQYTKFEKVEVQTGYSTAITGPPAGWDVQLELKNTGSATSTLLRAFVNDVLIPEANCGNNTIVAGECSTDMEWAGTSITSGNYTTVHVYISNTYGTLSAGTTINIKLHSAGGMDYIKLVELV